MAPALRPLLFGPAENRFGPYSGLALAGTLIAALVTGYVLDSFDVFLRGTFHPGLGGLLGMMAAVVVGYVRRGLVFALLFTGAWMLGYWAQRVFVRFSGDSVLDLFLLVFAQDQITYIAAYGLLLGTAGFAVGYLGRWGIRFVRGDATLAGFE